MTCNVYLNEASLCGQIGSQVTINGDEKIIVTKDVLVELMRCVKLIMSLPNHDVKVFYNPCIFTSVVVGDGTNLSQLLKIDRNIGQPFKELLKRLTQMTPSNIDPDSSYIYQGCDYRDTSVSEAFELHNGMPFSSVLINLAHSRFTTPVASVYKDLPTNSKDIDSYDNHRELIFQLIQNKLMVQPYDKTRQEVKPIDEQTILVDKTLFIPTAYSNHGQRLYERIGHDEYWCLDGGHSGRSSHLEVFDKNTLKEIHVSDIDRINYFRELTKDEEKRKCEMKQY